MSECIGKGRIRDVDFLVLDGADSHTADLAPDARGPEGDQMRTITDSHHQQGIVAVLDALGAANYGDEEIRRFMHSRQTVLGLLGEKAVDVADRLNVQMITTFTFNDTILVVLKSEGVLLRPNTIRAFFLMMRKFLVDSLVHRILFRGSLAIGSFHMDEKTNTILGEAVRDAAAWYDKTEWMGLIATPRTTIHIQHVIERDSKDWGHLMLEYPVPLNDGKRMSLKAVNWPILVDAISPSADGQSPRAKLLDLLRAHPIPRGVEAKFFNTIDFFDKAMAARDNSEARTTRSSRGGSARR